MNQPHRGWMVWRGCRANEIRSAMRLFFASRRLVRVMAAWVVILGGGAARGADETAKSEAERGLQAPVMREPAEAAEGRVRREPEVAHLGSWGREAEEGKAQALTAGVRERAAALAHYSAALQAEVEGDMRKAFVHYREMMRGEVEDAELVRRTVALAVRQGSEKEAEALLTERVKAQPGRPGPVLRLVEFMDAYQAGEAETARADGLMEEVLARFPQEAEVVTAAVLRHLVKGRRPRAMEVMRTAADGEGGDAAFWLALAGVAQEVWPLGQAEAAEQHRAEVNVFYEKALQAALRDKDRDRELEVAQYYVLSNQLGAARLICEVMAARNGDLAARKMLYRLYEAEDLKEKAFALLAGIVRDDPKDVSQRRMLAEVLEEREDYAEAARHLEAAMQVGTGTAADYEKLTNLWLGLRQPDKALTLVTRAIRLFPDTPGFQAQAAMAHAAKGDLPRAIQAFAEAEKLGGGGGTQVFNHRFHFRFGAVLEQADRHEEAAAQLKKSIEMTPESDREFQANTMNYLGYMWADLGQRLEEAEKWIRAAVQVEPENPAFIDSLGWLLHKQGKQAEALAELRKAEGLLKELAPEDAEILEHRAAVEEALGKKAEAVETLKRAAALQTPDEAVARRILQRLKRLGGEGG